MISPKKSAIIEKFETPNIEESGENLVKTMNGSFFDDANVKTKVFLNQTISLLQLQTNNIIYNKSVFLKKKKKTDECKNYHFFLTENGIYYMKVTQKALFFKKKLYFFLF